MTAAQKEPLLRQGFFFLPFAANRTASAPLLQRLYECLRIRRQVGRTARGDEVAVDDDRFIHPARSGIFHIVPDAGSRGHRTALQNLGGNEHPARMADLADRLAAGVHFLHELQHFGVAADFVRRPSSRDEKAVDAAGFELAVGQIGRCRHAVFADVDLSFIRTGEQNLRSFFTHAVDGVPQLEILEFIVDQADDALSLQGQLAFLLCKGLSRDRPGSRFIVRQPARRRKRLSDPADPRAMEGAEAAHLFYRNCICPPGRKTGEKGRSKEASDTAPVLICCRPFRGLRRRWAGALTKERTFRCINPVLAAIK